MVALLLITLCLRLAAAVCPPPLGLMFVPSECPIGSRLALLTISTGGRWLRGWWRTCKSTRGPFLRCLFYGNVCLV